MKYRHVGSCLVLLVGFVFSSKCWAQEDGGAAARVDVTKLKGNLHQLTCTSGYPVNAVASIGPDGVLLVDSGFEQSAQKLRAALTKLGGGPVRYIINTHLHSDHVGGNPLLDKDAVTIAHANTRQRLSRAYFSLPPLPVPELAKLTVADEITLHFNGEEIRVFHPGVAHTDGDLVVHFTGSGVVCLGDLLFSESFPFIHLAVGGDVERHTEVILKLASTLPADTLVVAGHGRHITVEELHAYGKMLRQTTDVIRTAMKTGKNVEEIHKARLLKRWSSYDGDTLTSSESWIKWVHNSLQRRANPVRPSICTPLTETIMTSGIAAAIRQYAQYRKAKKDVYDFSENQLNILGYQLLTRSMTGQAIAIFKLNVKEYPNSPNAYDSLGEAYMISGNKDLAIANYEQSLQLDPSNNNAQQKLRQLRKQ